MLNSITNKITNKLVLKQSDIEQLYNDFLNENQSDFDYAYDLLEDPEDGFDYLDASDYLIDIFENWLYSKIENTDLDQEYLQVILDKIFDEISSAFS